MAKRTQLLLLLVAIVFALVAAWLVTGMLDKVRQAHATTMASVLTVTEHIGAHQVIGQKDLQVTQVPASAVPAGALTSADKVVGQYTAGDWFPGQTVLADMVASTDSASSFPLKIPSGERAYSLADDAIIGVDHLISPGDHVDVLVTYPSSAQSKLSQAKTLLQDVVVLHVDNTPVVSTTTATASGSGKAHSSSSSSSGSSSSSSTVDTVILALKPLQAQELDYARTFGEVQLVLRNPNDSDVSTLSATTKP